MSRRQFIMLLGGAAAWPIAARAQQPAMPVIGLLSGASPEASRRPMAAFQRALADSGFNEGQSVTIDYRWADGRFDLLPAMAAEIVHRPVALIVAFSPPAALAAKAATTTIPIVFHSGGDVIKMGLVASLNRPSGNATGVNLFTQAVAAKMLDLLSKLVPTTATFAYLMNPNNPGADETTKEIREAARQLGRSVDIMGAGTESEIDAAFMALAEHRTGALVVMADQYFDEVPARTTRRAGSTPCHPDHLRAARLCGCRRPDQLRNRFSGNAPPGRHLRCPHSQGYKARGPAGTAADQVRVAYQPEDSKDARVEHIR
jgi:putative ABC transport system substrate-binding protein